MCLYLGLIKKVLIPVVANRFTVREHNLDEAEKQKQEIGRLVVDKKELYVSKS